MDGWEAQAQGQAETQVGCKENLSQVNNRSVQEDMLFHLASTGCFTCPYNIPTIHDWMAGVWTIFFFCKATLWIMLQRYHFLLYYEIVGAYSMVRISVGVSAFVIF